MPAKKHLAPLAPPAPISDPLDRIVVRDLQLRNLVGVDNWERSRPQPLRVSLAVKARTATAGRHDHLLADTVNYGALARAVAEFAESEDASPSFRSMEDLAVAIARLALTKFGGRRGAREVAVDIAKPRALLHAECAGVRVVRTEADVSVASPLSPSVTAAPAVVDGINGDNARAADPDTIYIRGLRTSAILGINPWERDEKQLVVVHLELRPATRVRGAGSTHEAVPRAYNYRHIAARVQAAVEASSFRTIEALCHHIAWLLLDTIGVHACTVSVEKPSALVFAESAGITVVRDQEWVRRIKAEQEREANAVAASLGPGIVVAADGSASAGSAAKGPLPVTFAEHLLPTVPGTVPRSLVVPDEAHPNVAYIAVGTNLGDRAGNIHRALSLVRDRAAAVIADTSFLYETKPMYVTDQPLYLNAAIKIYTPLDPHALLAALKTIEEDMGRQDTGRNGPRPIDLDILLYNTIVLATPTLEIPHPRIAEREFVLQPLSDVAPDLEHPTHFRTISKLLALVQHTAAAPDPITTSASTTTAATVAAATEAAAADRGGDVLQSVTPLSATTHWHWRSATRLMAILNVTPDSFSDGGDHISIDAAVAAAKAMQAAGVHVIDIGGQSTRPGAKQVGPAVEAARVVPAVRAMRAAGISVPISVDTYHASVARAALDAGATVVNDVTGGAGDPAMLPLVAERHVPIVVMHMRGDPADMVSRDRYAAGVVAGVAAELHVRVRAALAAGVPRWNIVVDPGIGFAKNGDQNFDLVAELPRLLRDAFGSHAFPVLVGPSRKRFIGDATGKTAAKDRTWGTAAAVAACVAGGADIVRVHDFKEMMDVIAVADKVWRRRH
ncbi:Dihydropteroate synthase-like protein [Blastocladiella britannica]|nr:Dihydropteroate synthase-like protein [Blastocladiella britannica]